LPDNCHFPAHLLQFPLIFGIPSDIVGEFPFPEFCVGLRRCRDFASFVAMPETTVYEDNGSVSRKNEVGFTRQFFPVKLVPETHGMNQGPDLQFGSRIFRMNARHIPAALKGCQFVCHCSIIPVSV
jgi:hypothetical protein